MTRQLSYLAELISFNTLVFIAFLILIGSVLSATTFGSAYIPIDQVIEALIHTPDPQSNESLIHSKIVWDIRLPRILMALITGAGLAVTGAVLQAITRNPLADPYLFGISSGASLGAVIVLVLFTSSTIGLTLGAFCGGMLSVFLMLLLAGRSALQVEKLLLSGVAVSFMLSAFGSLILYHADPEIAGTLLFWMMGSFSNSRWEQLWLPAIILLLSFIIFFVFRRWITAILAGEESAHTLGIPVNKLRLGLLIVCALLTAVLVAHTGGIGFVGLMIPHIARIIVGSQIQRVLLISFLLGAVFMIWVDVLAQTLLTHQVLPVGIVTSAVGSFFFFIILKKRSHKEI